VRRGFALFEVVAVLAILAVIAAIVVPGILRNRVRVSAATFRESDDDQDGNLDYGLLSELANTPLVDLGGGGAKQGYVFQASASFAPSEFIWFPVANPGPVGTER